MVVALLLEQSHPTTAGIQSLGIFVMTLFTVDCVKRISTFGLFTTLKLCLVLTNLIQQQKKLMPQHLVVFASGQKQKEKQKKMKNTESTK